MIFFSKLVAAIRDGRERVRAFVMVHRLSAVVILSCAGVYVLLGGLIPPDAGDFLAVGFWGWVIKLARFITLLVALRLLLWWLDRRLGIEFTTDILAELKNGNLAVSLYFTGRIVAVAILGHGFL